MLPTLAELQNRLGLRRRVRLMTSADVSMPLTFGAGRPVLLIPTTALDWGADRGQLVLLHELAHIHRWDWLTQMLAHVACAAHWFNPLAWLAARRMRIEREQARDDLVLAQGAIALALLVVALVTVEPEIVGRQLGRFDLGPIAVQEPAAQPKAEPQPPRPSPQLDEFLRRVRQSRRGPFGGDRVTKNERGEITGLGLSEFQFQPGDAAVIGQLSELTWLRLQRSNIKDEDLQQFQGLAKLTALNLWDTKIGDAGVAALAELSALQSLQLGGTGVSDAGLASVAKLKALRELDLARTKITDAGLASLAPLSKLIALKLAETSIGDEGLVALDKMPALCGVTLDETKVTANGLERLAMRALLNYLASDLLVAQELAARMSAADAAGVDAMLSIGVDLPHTGTFRTRAVLALPVTARDTERQRKRFRIEWHWNNKGRQEGLFAEIAVRQGSVRVTEAGVLELP